MAVVQQPETDARTRKAATESMIVCRIAPAMFEVYSGTQGRYLVDVGSGSVVCTCDDFHYRDDEIDACNHGYRALMTLGEMEIPKVRRVDPALPVQREGWSECR